VAHWPIHQAVLASKQELLAMVHSVVLHLTIATICADAHNVSLHGGRVNKSCVANLRAHLQEVADLARHVHELWRSFEDRGISVLHWDDQDVEILMNHLANGCSLLQSPLCRASQCGTQLGETLCNLQDNVQALTRSAPQKAGNDIWQVVRFEISHTDKPCFRLDVTV